MGKHKLLTEETAGVQSGVSSGFDLTYHVNPHTPAKGKTCKHRKARYGESQRKENIDMLKRVFPWADILVCENLPCQEHFFYVGSQW